MISALSVAIAAWIHVAGGTWAPTSELKAIQAELRPYVEASAASQGKKLSPKDKGDVDRYNSLLNQYLGARCHV